MIGEIEVVPTGDLGLDVLTGGGWRLVERLKDKKSATVLIRGGAGAGKTLLGLEVARSLASALDGDVAVGCVEILPSEYVAQLRSSRPDLDESQIVMLPARAASEAGPRVYCALLPDLEPQSPDLVAGLEILRDDVKALGGNPKVFIVDSLSEGYGTGSSTPRLSADAVMKLAADGGYGLVLCEETGGEPSSPWLFAADTVIELGVESRQRGRWLEVRKHRFGPSVSGRHELELGGGARPTVYPEPYAYVAGSIEVPLVRNGWDFASGPGTPALLSWAGPLRTVSNTPDALKESLEGRFALVISGDTGLARTLALGLLPSSASMKRDLIIDLDPLMSSLDSRHEEAYKRYFVPTVHGPKRSLRVLVECVAQQFDPTDEHRGPLVRRVVLGDLGNVLNASDALQWAEAVRVFAILVLESGWGVPVIGYAGSGHGAVEAAARSILGSHADLRITAVREPTAAGPVIDVTVTERWRRQRMALRWPTHLDTAGLPEGLQDLDHIPR